MKVDFNSQSPKSNPQFGRIDIGSAESTLRKVLKPKEWQEFSKLIEEQKSNPVGINLFGHNNSNKLSANVFTEDVCMPNSFCKSYSQRFLESQLKFIKRCCKYANEFRDKLETIKNVNVDEIINNARK